MTRTPPSITAYRDGPFLVRGPVTVVDEEGRTVEVRRRVVPLCRCGRSRTQPLCDGTHEASGPRRQVPPS
jgi:CDGSH-type Zn-finger protein